MNAAFSTRRSLELRSSSASALHPETEVDYVTHAESLMEAAYLMTLYGFIRGSESDHRWRWYGVSIASCWLGMLCKESMATAPVMVLLYDVVFCAGSLSKALRERGALYRSRQHQSLRSPMNFNNHAV
jgi:hypothetical protein